MRDMHPVWVDLGEGVEVNLKPLTLGQKWELDASMNDRGIPGFSAVSAVWLANVLEWKGAPDAYSNENRAKVIVAGGPSWQVIVMRAIGELYKRYTLSEDEAKN